MNVVRRSAFVYGETTWETEISARPWIPADFTIGGSRTAAAGVPASSIVRRDALIVLTLRIEEPEWDDLLAFVRYGQSAPPFTWYPDADEAQGIAVYLDAPLAGERWAPTRLAEYQRVFEMTITLRQVSTTIWQPYFVDQEG